MGSPWTAYMKKYKKLDFNTEDLENLSNSDLSFSKLLDV